MHLQGISLYGYVFIGLAVGLALYVGIRLRATDRGAWGDRGAALLLLFFGLALAGLAIVSAEREIRAVVVRQLAAALIVSAAVIRTSAR